MVQRTDHSQRSLFEDRPAVPSLFCVRKEEIVKAQFFKIELVQCINQGCCLSGFADVVKEKNHVNDDLVKDFVKDAMMDFAMDFATGFLSDFVKGFWRNWGRIL